VSPSVRPAARITAQTARLDCHGDLAGLTRRTHQNSTAATVQPPPGEAAAVQTPQPLSRHPQLISIHDLIHELRSIAA
jgi:hypothetical protein